MLVKKLYLFIVTIFYYLPGYASVTVVKQRPVVHRLPIPKSDKSNLGGVASDLFGISREISQVFRRIALVIGIGFILFGIMQYKKHRSNPVATPLSTVIMTIVIGLSLIALSFIPMKF